MIALALLGAAFWALMSRKPSAFMWYFFAQIAYIPAIYGMAWAYGQDSGAYLLAYIGMTGLVLSAVVLVAWNALAGRLYRLRAAAIALVLAIVLGKMAFMGLEHPKAEDFLVLIEAVVLLWAGIVTSYVARYRPDKWAYFTLGTMWIGYALWDFGLILHHPYWVEADWYVPGAWNTLGFVIVGFLLRRVSSAATA